ncbi:MAG: cupredoxin domain-containing protein [Candidatus Binatia bacterium]
MTHRFGWRMSSLAVLTITLCFSAPSGGRVHQMVIVPEEDRFLPFSLTIRAGESVRWVNGDTDDHTVVSDDAFTPGPDGGIQDDDGTFGTPMMGVITVIPGGVGER